MDHRKRNIETIAWAVIWSGFAVFLISCGVLLTGARWYLAGAREARESQLTIIKGTVWVQNSGQQGWETATPEQLLKEHTKIRTVDTAEALVTLFDKSTLILFPLTEVELSTLSIARFDPKKQYLGVTLREGKVHLGVAPTVNGSKAFEVRSSDGLIRPSEGSYDVTATSGGTTVRVRDSGMALVTAQNRSVEVRPGQKTVIRPYAPPQPPQDTREELVVNGDFRQGLAGWQTGNDIGFPPGQDVEGEVTVVRESGEPALHFKRRGSRGTHDETWVYQDLKRDVSDFGTLRLSFKLKILHHNLSGGGYEGSEYPVLVRLRYNSAVGPQLKVYGFYYHNEDNNRTDNGMAVPYETWVEYTVPENLMTVIPSPREIESIQVSASGWDFESLVSFISLIGE